MIGASWALVALIAAWAPTFAANGDTEATAGAVLELATALRDRYVFPQTGEDCAGAVLAAFEADELPLEDPAALADRLTSMLAAVADDRHLTVRFEPPSSVSPTDGTERTAHERYNHGFARVERLRGNVGYLELTGFHDPEVAGPTAVAAMRFLAGCDALVLDLRKNGGGSAEMVKLMASWLLPPETALAGIHWRGHASPDQAWAESHMPVERRLEVPVFVLTTGYTFSAAEALAYDLQVAGRATIVGRGTGGGAHPGEEMALGGGFHVWMPTGRAVHPATGTNWEGVGVEVDVDVPGERAFDAAYALVLEELVRRAVAPDRRLELASLAEWRRALWTAPCPGQEERAGAAGDYGLVSVVDAGTGLLGAVAGGAFARLAKLPSGAYRFELDPRIELDFESGSDGRRFLVVTSSDGEERRLSRRETPVEGPSR